jgi:hypothetical protein
VRRLVAISIMGCGRIGFDPAGGSIDGSTDLDTIQRVGPCPLASTAPDPITISGVVERVSFAGGSNPEPGATVEVSATVGATPFAMTTSAGNGTYALVVPTGGVPIAPVFTLRDTGLLSSVYVPDAPVDANIVSMYSPIGTNTAVSALYFAGGVSRLATAGTLFLTVVDCDGNAVEGVTVSISPDPGSIIYGTDSGLPSQSETSTRARGFVWGLNVPTGTVSVTGMKAGETFLTHDVTILSGGSYFMGSQLRPVR